MNQETNKISKEEMMALKDLTSDPSDNRAPYGTKNYIPPEYRFVKGVYSTTIAAQYKVGKVSKLIYDVPLSPSGMRCYHLCMTCMNPCSCTLCNSAALQKYSFTRIYDDHVETNVATSCCMWISDNTSVYYLDRDWAQNFELASPCLPAFTHCTPFPDCCGLFGKTVIGHGKIRAICSAGGRPIAASPMDCYAGGPLCCFGMLPFGNEQWACFPFVEPEHTEAFIDHLKRQRAEMETKHNIVAGSMPIVNAPETHTQERV